MSTLRRFLVSTFAVAGLAACPPPDAPNPAFDAGTTRYCSTSLDCPIGLLCIAFVCQPPPTDAGPRDLGPRDQRPDTVATDLGTTDAGSGDGSTADRAAEDGAVVADAALPDVDPGDCGCPHPDSGSDL